MPKKKLNRILIKLSGESLMGNNKFGIDLNTVKRISNDLLSLKKLKIQICIVIGGGNIFRGLAASAKGMDRASADYMGMLATVMNSLALQNTLEKLNVETRVMSAFPIQSICETYIRRRAIRHIEKGRIVIVAGGTGNPFFTTDSAAALRAKELGAQIVIKGTKVDGIYDKDPIQNSNAKKFETITFSEVFKKNLRVMDLTAITLCKENNLPIHVLNINIPGNLKQLLLGSKIGTQVTGE